MSSSRICGAANTGRAYSSPPLCPPTCLRKSRKNGSILWDITFRTAVAQAELEDKEQPAAYHAVTFHQPDGGRIEIATTRPELLPACVALVAHPDDEIPAPFPM